MTLPQEADLEARDSLAESRPRQRRVDVDDVS